MEQLTVSLDDGAKFDRCLEEGLPEDGNVELIIKEAGTESGQPIVMLTWTVMLPSGAFRRVQAVTTTRLLAMAGMAVAGHHERITGECLIPRVHN